MTNTTKTLVVVACLALTTASTVAAQTPAAQVPPAPATRGFVNVDFGAQPARGTINTANSFPKYDETVTFAAEGGVANGPFFQVAGGVNVWRSLSVGVGYSRFSSKSDSTVTATVPHPLFFNQPRTSSQTVPDMQRTENGVHLMALWLIPVTDKIDVSLFGGPSFIRVEQQLVASVTIIDGTQNFTPGVSTNNGTAKGANVGIDGTYMINRNFGVGLLLRYAGGKVDLESASAVKVGGFQAAVGARVRF
jgi:hypothetical protein